MPDSLSKSVPSRPSRRFLPRITVRRMLMMTALVAILFAVGNHYVFEAQREHGVIGNLPDQHLNYAYDYQINDQGNVDRNATPNGPKWLRKWLGDLCIARVEHIEIWSDENGVSVDLECLSEIKKLRSLDRLTLHNVESIENADCLEKIVGVRELDLSYCAQLEHVDGLSNFKHLESLSLEKCESLTSIKGLSRLKSLRKLDLSRCKSLKSLEGLQGLTNLKELSLNECVALTNLDELKSLGQLESLELTHCRNIENLDVLKKLTQLKYLNLFECTGLRDVDFLSELPELEWLVVQKLIVPSGAKSWLPKLTKLKTFFVSGRLAEDCLPYFSELKQLETLHISECMAVNAFMAGELKQLPGLKRLEVVDCGKVEMKKPLPIPWTQSYPFQKLQIKLLPGIELHSPDAR